MQRSIEDALAEEIAANIIYIILSYVVMIIYVSVALGRFSLVESKILLGLGGVLCVVFGLLVSFGITRFRMPLLH